MQLPSTTIYTLCARVLWVLALACTLALQGTGGVSTDYSYSSSVSTLTPHTRHQRPLRMCARARISTDS